MGQKCKFMVFELVFIFDFKKSFSADIGKNKEDLIYKIQIHSCKTVSCQSLEFERFLWNF